MSVLSKIFNFIKSLVTRAGLDVFLKKYQAAAIQIVAELAAVNSGVGFHEWKDAAFEKFKAMLIADGVAIKDNWLSIALSLAFEVYKAEKSK